MLFSDCIEIYLILHYLLLEYNYLLYDFLYNFKSISYDYY